MTTFSVVLRRAFRIPHVMLALREGPRSKLIRCVSTAAAKAALDVGELRRMVDEARTPRQRETQMATQRNPRVFVDGGRWRCCACGIKKGVENFYISKTDRVFSYCKECEMERRTANRRTLRGNAQVLLHNARGRSKLKGWKFDLDIDIILGMILQQQGRCAYSGVPMELLLPHSDWRMSLERLDNDLGYLQENCVLVAAEFNTPGKISKKVAKNENSGSSQWSLEKVLRLPAERDSNVDLLSLQQSIEAARSKPRALSQPEVFTAVDCEIEEAPVHLRCSKCGLWKPSHCFSSCQRGNRGFHCYCKQCSNDCNLAHRMTLRGHMLQMLRHARTRHRLGKWTGDYELGLEHVLEMLWSQEGRCFYSGVPLRFAQYNVDWMMSLERLDNNKTYTKDNTVLIALEFNTADHSMNKAASSVLGSSQWSRKKVEIVWGSCSSTFSQLCAGKIRCCFGSLQCDTPVDSGTVFCTHSCSLTCLCKYDKTTCVVNLLRRCAAVMVE